MAGRPGEWNGWYAAGKTKVTSPARGDRDREPRGSRRPTRARWPRATRAPFPGYFTLDTTVGGKKGGMLSVNAATGAVWYHGWHGGFLAERDYSP